MPLRKYLLLPLLLTVSDQPEYPPSPFRIGSPTSLPTSLFRPGQSQHTHLSPLVIRPQNERRSSPLSLTRSMSLRALLLDTRQQAIGIEAANSARVVWVVLVFGMIAATGASTLARAFSR